MKIFPSSLALFLFTIFLLNTVANWLSWYWRIGWFDMFMHFLGGMWVALSATWYVYGKRRICGISVWSVSLTTVLVVAVLWEIFELFVGMMFPSGEPYDVIDTLSDILFGFLGGVFATKYFSRYFMGYNEKK